MKRKMMKLSTLLSTRGFLAHKFIQKWEQPIYAAFTKKKILLEIIIQLRETEYLNNGRVNNIGWRKRLSIPVDQ